MTSQNRKSTVKGSRIRERDKKITEYYVGDYSYLGKLSAAKVDKGAGVDKVPIYLSYSACLLWHPISIAIDRSRQAEVDFKLPT